MFLMVLLFVDDAQGFLHCFAEDINHAIQKANADSEALVGWSSDHGVSLNPAKTLAIVVGSRHNLNKINSMTLQPIIVGGHIIPLTDCVKSLGLTISQDLR